MKSSWFCPATCCRNEPSPNEAPQIVDGDLAALDWIVKGVQIWARSILCVSPFTHLWESLERVALNKTGVYCVNNRLPSSTSATIEHWVFPISPCSLLSLWLLHHWFICPIGACRTPSSLFCKLAWGDGSHCAHKTHKTRWKFQPCDNDPNFHEPIKRSKKLAGRVQDHAYLCRITCRLGREAERRM